MLRRSKKLASLILVMGLGLGVVGCGNKKVDETNKDNLTTMSKNDAEETENTENHNETLKEEITDTTNSSTNTPSVNSNLSNSSSSNSKPSTATKPSNSNSSSSKPSTTTKPSNSNSSNSKPSTTTKPSNSNSSNSKPSTTTKPSNSSSSSNKPSTTTKPSNSSSSNSKPSTTRTWQYMSSLSKETFNALNEFRKANGVAPLKYNSAEQSRANKQAESNVKNNINTHEMLQISYKGNADSTSNGFIQAWAKSPSHKKSMLDEGFSEGAVSVYKDSKGYYYVVASFHLDW